MKQLLINASCLIARDGISSPTWSYQLQQTQYVVFMKQYKLMEVKESEIDQKTGDGE